MKARQVLIVGYDRSLADALMALHDGERRLKVTVINTLAEGRRALTQGRGPLDVVILRHHLPDGLGEQLLSDVEAFPRQPTAIIVGANLQDLLPESLQYRPIIIPETASTSAVVQIVSAVSNGYTCSLLKRFSSHFHLTTREAQALVSLSQGRRAKEIAARMGCTEPTVYGHLRRICEKTNTKASSELMACLFAFACQAHGRTPLDYDAYQGS